MQLECGARQWFIFQKILKSSDIARGWWKVWSLICVSLKLKDLMMWKGCHQGFDFDFSFSMLFISNSHLECTIAQRRLWKWLKLNLEAKWHRYRHAEDSRSLKKGMTVPGEKRGLWLQEAPSLPEEPRETCGSQWESGQHTKASPDAGGRPSPCKQKPHLGPTPVSDDGQRGQATVRIGIFSLCKCRAS